MGRKKIIEPPALLAAIGARIMRTVDDVSGAEIKNLVQAYAELYKLGNSEQSDFLEVRLSSEIGELSK